MGRSAPCQSCCFCHCRRRRSRNDLSPRRNRACRLGAPAWRCAAHGCARLANALATSEYVAGGRAHGKAGVDVCHFGATKAVPSRRSDRILDPTAERYAGRANEVVTSSPSTDTLRPRSSLLADAFVAATCTTRPTPWRTARRRPARAGFCTIWPIDANEVSLFCRTRLLSGSRRRAQVSMPGRPTACQSGSSWGADASLVRLVAVSFATTEHEVDQLRIASGGN